MDKFGIPIIRTWIMILELEKILKTFNIQTLTPPNSKILD